MNRCCDDYTGECNQGRSCPTRKPYTIWCETSRQPCFQPYTCAPACALKQDNSDGTAQHAEEVWELTPMGLVVLSCLAFWLAAISVYFFYF